MKVIVVGGRAAGVYGRTECPRTPHGSNAYRKKTLRWNGLLMNVLPRFGRSLEQRGYAYPKNVLIDNIAFIKTT